MVQLVNNQGVRVIEFPGQTGLINITVCQDFLTAICLLLIQNVSSPSDLYYIFALHINPIENSVETLTL